MTSRNLPLTSHDLPLTPQVFWDETDETITLHDLQRWVSEGTLERVPSSPTPPFRSLELTSTAMSLCTRAHVECTAIRVHQVNRVAGRLRKRLPGTLCSASLKLRVHEAFMTRQGKLNTAEWSEARRSNAARAATPWPATARPRATPCLTCRLWHARPSRYRPDVSPRLAHDALCACCCWASAIRFEDEMLISAGGDPLGTMQLHQYQ